MSVAIDSDHALPYKDIVSLSSIASIEGVLGAWTAIILPPAKLLW